MCLRPNGQSRSDSKLRCGWTLRLATLSHESWEKPDKQSTPSKRKTTTKIVRTVKAKQSYSPQACDVPKVDHQGHDTRGVINLLAFTRPG